jgi:hypothetical protein
MNGKTSSVLLVTIMGIAAVVLVSNLSYGDTGCWYNGKQYHTGDQVTNGNGGCLMCKADGEWEDCGN